MRSSLSHSRPRAKLMLVSQITADDERVVDLPALAVIITQSTIDLTLNLRFEIGSFFSGGAQ